MWLILVLACTRPSAPLPTPVPTVDQPAWLAELVAHRPGLVRLHEGSVQDPAWEALVLRPRYRAAFLASETETVETLLAREYTDAQRTSDVSWVRSLRDARGAFVPTATIDLGGYDGRAYVGYRLGPRIAYDADGLVYKAFFEFSDFQRSLSAERYAGFVAALEALGFRGDSKIDLRSGRTRFQYNQLIVHAPSIEMARCAEAVGLAYFGDEVEHVARGVDVVGDGRPLDWHHFLLTGRYAALPDSVRDFVAYRLPVADRTVCP